MESLDEFFLLLDNVGPNPIRRCVVPLPNLVHVGFLVVVAVPVADDPPCFPRRENTRVELLRIEPLEIDSCDELFFDFFFLVQDFEEYVVVPHGTLRSLRIDQILKLLASLARLDFFDETT